jgi:hypothetical protein
MTAAKHQLRTHAQAFGTVQAYEARSGSAGKPDRMALLTDGITRLTSHYDYEWPEIFALLEQDGPTGLIGQVRQAELASPPPAAGFGKQHDDATAVYIRVT